VAMVGEEGGAAPGVARWDRGTCDVAVGGERGEEKSIGENSQTGFGIAETARNPAS